MFSTKIVITDPEEMKKDIRNILSNFWYVLMQAENGVQILDSEIDQFVKFYREMDEKYRG